MASSPNGSPPPSPAMASPPSPPSNSSSPPPSPSVASSPPPQSPPSPPPASPPPPTSPPPASPPPTAPPPSSPPPPPVVASPPPVSASSPPPPPQAAAEPPPAASASPPPSQSAPPPSPSPPPSTVPSPPSSESSPPPKSHPSSPPPPSAPASEAPSKLPSGPAPSPPPPQLDPSSSLPPAGSPPSTPSNSSNAGIPISPPLPSIPTEKPTARATDGTNVNANSTASGPGGLKTGGAIAIGIVVGFVALSLLVTAVWLAERRKRKSAQSNGGYNLGMPSPFASSQNSDSVFLKPHSPAGLRGSVSGNNFMYSPPEQGAMNNSRSWFTYEELLHATDGFSSQNILGEGGFGCVYKGILADGREVAVKQLKIGSGQGEREFRAEVEIISRVHHRHLVSLVGYCIVEQHRLLVYDYVPNNTLHYHLLSGEGLPVLDWATRVKVAAGAARGIAYLHEDCHPRIIHRDIKSSNILIDNNFEAQVSDFGLAKLALDSNTHVTTRVMGTFGYMAPEYATSGKLTEKSDVYSFGVVLLELITGRKPVDASQPLGDESLVEWARPLLAQALEDEDFEGLVDAKLGKKYVASEMFRMIEAAAACVRHSATKRPRMSQVVRALDSLDELSDLSNGVRPGQSEIYDSREQSAQIRMFRRMAFGSQDYSSEFFNRSQTQSSWRSRGYGDQSM